MAWIRLSDDYTEHPKFRHLGDGPFRLWHEGMAFCRKYQTDGYIPMEAVRKLRAYSPKRMRELMTPWTVDASPLWHDVEGVGIKVHDYLDWNPSKEEDAERRAESKERMRQIREQRRSRGVPPPFAPSSQPVRANTTQTHAPVLVQGVDQDREWEKEDPNEVGVQARKFLERFQELYRKHRHGAHYRVKDSLDWTRVCDLLANWDAARLEKLAVIILTTDEEWVTKTDRGIGILAARASWADDRLRAWEVEQMKKGAVV